MSQSVPPAIMNIGAIHLKFVTASYRTFRIDDGEYVNKVPQIKHPADGNINHVGIDDSRDF